MINWCKSKDTQYSLSVVIIVKKWVENLLLILGKTTVLYII